MDQKTFGDYEFRLEKLYLDYSRELYWVALAYCNDESLARDMVQEVFLYLTEHPEKFKSIANPYSYLVSMIRNRVLDYFRHQQVRRSHEPEIVREILDNTDTDDDVQVDDAYLSKVAKAKQLLDSLPPRCRAVFVKAVMEGMTYQEVAKSEGISVNTVKSQVKIALKKLREAGGVNVIILLLSQIN